MTSQPRVGLIMGSDSDWPVMQDAAGALAEFDVPFEVGVVSAHRTPARMLDYAQSAAGRGIEVIIAGAGGAKDSGEGTDFHATASGHVALTPLQIDLHLIRMSEHQSKNTSPAHLEAFYQPFREARASKFDGLLITGAPIGHLAYDQIEYWPELCDVFRWTQEHVTSTFNLCWAAMAALHFHHQVDLVQLAVARTDPVQPLGRA